MIDAPDNFRAGRQWNFFKNDTGETVPAFGVMRVTDFLAPAVTGADFCYCSIVKPDSYGCNGNYFINGPVDVADGNYGACAAVATCSPYSIRRGLHYRGHLRTASTGDLRTAVGN